MSATHRSIELDAEFGATRSIRVRDRRHRELSTVHDPERVERVMSVLRELHDGWYVPDSGVPIAPVVMEFHGDEGPVGNIGVGADYLSAHVFGTFVARDTDAETAERLMKAARAGRAFRDVVLAD